MSSIARVPYAAGPWPARIAGAIGSSRPARQAITSAFRQAGRSGATGEIDDSPDGWWLARLDATVGYVSDAQVRDQIEPRLIIRRLPVGWRIAAMEFYD